MPAFGSRGQTPPAIFHAVIPPNAMSPEASFPESAVSAAQAGLVYVSDSQPGIRRVRRGMRFAYVGPGNRALTDPAELERIARLAIPPAYTDVWICGNPRGHVQATGRDARGRKQYRYHAQWRTVRDDDKFGRMSQFGAALPKLRRRLKRDLALPGLPRDKVLAVVGSLLDTTRVRIGNSEYARDNNSFGLTTLRNRHVKFIRDHRAVLRFRGKGGAEHEVAIDDRRIVAIVRHCQDLPGQLLFQYIDDSGERRPVDSELVNAYLREAMGGEFTAKDFRTWGATVRAIALMAAAPLPEERSERALNACIVEVVKQVAEELRNTPAVCRKSYINPLVFSAWRSGELHKVLGPDLRVSPKNAERVAMKFLNSAEHRRSQAAPWRRTVSSTRFAAVRSPTTEIVSVRQQRRTNAPRLTA